VKVIGGRWRGRPLQAPRGSAARPSAARLREALISAVLPWIEGARVLDLFAGSGALGIEALSRGAVTCVFVERAANAVRTLRRNVAELDLTDRCRILIGPVDRRLGDLEGAGATFDIVFLDPPYGAEGVESVLARAAGLITAEGRIVWEHGRRSAAPPAELALVDERAYGGTVVSVLVRRPGA
jgi:16S rRNA (guanine966-N2)-methyltransferase